MTIYDALQREFTRRERDLQRGLIRHDVARRFDNDPRFLGVAIVGAVCANA